MGSTLVSRLNPDPAADALEAKGSRRDPWQVLANGAAAAVAALLVRGHPPVLWPVTASLAAAAADTWATSWGARNRTPPRHIVRWTPVPAGTSGGVSAAGTAGAAAGAFLVAAAGAAGAGDPALFVPAAVIGFTGMLLDSLLGAIAQGRFRCPRCDVPTERRRHHCGERAVRIGGWSWLDNDGVNALTTLFGAAAGWAMWLWHSASS